MIRSLLLVNFFPVTRISRYVLSLELFHCIECLQRALEWLLCVCACPNCRGGSLLNSIVVIICTDLT